MADGTITIDVDIPTGKVKSDVQAINEEVNRIGNKAGNKLDENLEKNFSKELHSNGRVICLLRQKEVLFLMPQEMFWQKVLQLMMCMFVQGR